MTAALAPRLFLLPPTQHAEALELPSWLLLLAFSRVGPSTCGLLFSSFSCPSVCLRQSAACTFIAHHKRHDKDRQRGASLLPRCTTHCHYQFGHLVHPDSVNHRLLARARRLWPSSLLANGYQPLASPHSCYCPGRIPLSIAFGIPRGSHFFRQGHSSCRLSFPNILLSIFPHVHESVAAKLKQAGGRWTAVAD